MCKISLALPSWCALSMHPLFYSLCLFYLLHAALYNTHSCPQRKIITKGKNECCFSIVCSKHVKANSRKCVTTNCLSIVHTSISPSNSEESSRVTLKGMVLSRLEPFWGDLRFLFGDVFSDISSVSLCSSRCLEFCSFTNIEKQRFHLSSLIPRCKK